MKTKSDELVMMRAAVMFPRPIDAFKQLDLNAKRAKFILEKWAQRGWWDYTDNILRGHSTESGKEHFKEMLGLQIKTKSA